MTRRPELRYYALRAVMTPGFMMPVSTLYLLANDVSYGTLGFAAAVTAAVTVLAEVPTGYASDRVGRRATVATSQVLFAAYPLVLALSPTRPGTLIAFAVLGLAETLQSGAVSAWCYDALDAVGRADEYTAVAGRGGAIRFATLAVTAVVGGVLYAVEPVYPIVAAAAMGGLGLPLALSLAATGEGERHRDDDADPLSPGEALATARRFLGKSAVRGFVVVVAATFAAARAVGSFVQPVAVDGLRPLLGGVTVAGAALPETAVLGVGYALFAASASVASEHASDVRTHLGTGPTLLAGTVTIGVAFMLPLAAPILVVPAMALHRATISVVVPLKNAYLNEQLAGVGRATVLSAASLVFAVAKVPVTALSGALADRAGPVPAVAALGGFIFTVTIVMHVVGRPVHEDRPATAPAD